MLETGQEWESLADYEGPWALGGGNVPWLIAVSGLGTCVQTEQSILLELEYKSHHSETDNNIVWSLCSQTAEELFF